MGPLELKWSPGVGGRWGLSGEVVGRDRAVGHGAVARCGVVACGVDDPPPLPRPRRMRRCVFGFGRESNCWDFGGGGVRLGLGLGFGWWLLW